MKSDTEKAYFPLFLDISDKKFLVVGGGKVAERKIRALLRLKAKVKAISPKMTKGIKHMAEKGLIEIEEKPYESGELEGYDFVISATNDKDVNRRISSDARKMGILANVVDDPELCNFIMPSIVKKGPIIVAISTSGKIPLLSKKLRKDLEKMIDDDYLKYVSKIGKIRKELLDTVKDRKMREKMLRIISTYSVKQLANMKAKEIKEIVSGIRG